MISRPVDDYDPLWTAYWQANPHLMRSVGAAAAEGEGEGAEGGQEGAEGAATGQEGAEGGEAGKAEDGAQAGVHGVGKEGADTGKAGDEGKAEDGKKAEQDAEPGDWRDAIKDPEARKLAEDSTDPEHLAKRALDMRKKLANAIVKPGKDAPEEEVAAYRKALGVPDSPDKYEWPDLPEGQEVTDEVKASREAWAQRFHELNVPADTAKQLAEQINEDIAKAQQAQVEADKQFAEQQAEALRSEWGADYDKNKTFANRAASTLAERAGVNLEDLRHIETKDGRFLMDRADMLKLFATVGREMGEGSLGGVATESERDAVETEIRQLREKQDEAQKRGDSKEANRLYQKEQEAIARLGNKPVVGAQGRAA